MAAAAALWLPPAAKKGQGDCDFPLGPPWILLYPLKRRRSAEGLEAAERCVLARRSAVGTKCGYVDLRSAVALLVVWRILAPLVLEGATLWLPPAAKEGQGDCEFPLGPPWILLYPLKRRRSAEGLEAAGRGVLTRRSAAGAKGWVLLCVLALPCRSGCHRRSDAGAERTSPCSGRVHGRNLGLYWGAGRHAPWIAPISPSSHSCVLYISIIPCAPSNRPKNCFLTPAFRSAPFT